MRIRTLALLLLACCAAPPHQARAPIEATRVNPTDVVLSRTFAATPAEVFAAFTEVDAFREWFAPEGWTMESSQMDLRVGGRYRHEMVTTEDARVVMHGEYLTVDPPHRLEFTEAYEGVPYDPFVVTTTLTPSALGTRMESTVRHPSEELADANTGIAVVAAKTYERLAAYLAANAGSPDR